MVTPPFIIIENLFQYNSSYSLYNVYKLYEELYTHLKHRATTFI